MAAKKISYDTSDWTLYRSKEIVKVGHQEGEKILVQGRDGEVRKISEQEFLADYEPVKGLIKNAF